MQATKVHVGMNVVWAPDLLFFQEILRENNGNNINKAPSNLFKPLWDENEVLAVNLTA